MVGAFSAARVRAAEEALMAGLPDGELMSRAAAGLAEVCRVRLSARDGTTVVGLVGPGNNGGDALFALARLAADGFGCVAVRGGWPVHEEGLEAARGAGVRLVDGTDAGAAAAALAHADLVVDGVLGIGGRPGLPEVAAPWVDAVPDGAYVVAVDLPSGQDPSGESGSDSGVFADETVTFGVPKPVHLMPATEPAVGRLTVVDIGLDVEGAPDVERLGWDDVAALWPVPSAADDKYSRGVLGVVAGGEDYTGAPVLCCTAAVEAGVGMVRYCGTPTPTALVRAAVPEAVVGEGRVQAWVVGPGLDLAARPTGSRAQLGVARSALASDLPVLVDAGGLDLVTSARTGPTLLTPHAGELARLLTRLEGHEVTREDVAARPLASARRAADALDATVLLKGSTTLVVPPTASGRPVRSQADAPPWLATAGAGDVLAGLAGTLLAAGLDPIDAGSLAALVHGVAADRANPGGPLRALAVARGIPATVAALLSR
ncbi:MAG TPA: NAD(P)H-hydrate dehydratase [Pedococcus sp.]|nr:NAD(P)H-hydrate dehydratase [Pedococcus sp.]